jgi:hypothetical protein
MQCLLMCTRGLREMKGKMGRMKKWRGGGVYVACELEASNPV